MTRTALDKPRFFLNRHWQWMVFNQRMEMPFSVKGAQFRERVCNEILPAYLLWIIARRACWRLRGLYTHSRRNRGGSGFSVQDHLMRLALGGVNGSAQSKERHTQVANTRSQKVTAPRNPR
jgi:hypothetical protein